MPLVPASRRAVIAAAILLASAIASASVEAQAPAGLRAARVLPRAGNIKVRWLGHAAFEIVSPAGARILIDPWLAQNPSTPDSLKSTQRWTGDNRADAILVTHAHFDHSGDAKAIAQASGAPVIGAYEFVSTLGLPEAQAMGGNVGGTMKIRDVTIHLVPAMHSSDPGGRPLGFVLRFPNGHALYHTGDTWIFNDMSLIQELYRPDILLFGVGGGPFTQDPATAALAIRKYFTPRVIVPMHFGTFPALATEAQVRAAFASERRVIVMRPGEMRTF